MHKLADVNAKALEHERIIRTEALSRAVCIPNADGSIENDTAKIVSNAKLFLTFLRGDQ
jgi:hypothetical protein